MERKAWFVDCNGLRWDTAVTASTIRRVRSEVDLNLLAMVDPKSDLLTKCYDDPVSLFGLLCAVVRPQLTERGLSDDQFGDLLNSEAIAEAAVDAVLDGVIGFFPEARRAILAGAIQKLRKARDRFRTKAAEKGAERLASPELDDLIERSLQKALGD